MTRKSILAALVLLMTSGAANADPIDDRLRTNREAMVAAVALLVTLPPNCTMNNQRPDPQQVARWVYGLGYRDYDAFIAEVEKKNFQGEDYQRMSESEKKAFLEGMCAYGALLSAKVRDANK